MESFSNPCHPCNPWFIFTHQSKNKAASSPPHSKGPCQTHPSWENDKTSKSSVFRKDRSVSPSVAVVGATGAVGEIMRQVLAEHKFPLRSIKFLASERSAGKSIDFQGKRYPI